MMLMYKNLFLFLFGNYEYHTILDYYIKSFHIHQTHLIYLVFDFDKLKIKCMYSIAAMLTRENKEPWHIDHIIPLQGKMVSGLHVPSNLQVMLGSENIGKKNKFEVNHA